MNYNNYDTFLLGSYQFIVALLFLPMTADPSWFGIWSWIIIGLNIFCGIGNFIRYGNNR